jgi:peptidylprolyl isomerase
MKKLILALALFSGALLAETAVNKDHLSETLGHFLVRHLGSSEFEINIEKVIQGIKDEVAGRPAPMSEEEYESAMIALSEEAFKKSADQNLAKAQAFLDKQAQQPAMQAIEGNKIVFKVDREGSGSAIKEGDIPVITYHGTLMDGSVFASSQSTGQPIALPLDQAIPGFSIGLKGMKEGEKRTLYIHPELAYGTQGQLPPNSLLIFEIELLKANADVTMNLRDQKPSDAS